MELLHQRRCRVLKRVPKASRIAAADKLAETLRRIVADPDCIDKWMNLLLFTFACFSVPGQRGGKRHLSSLASKVNQAVAAFPSVIPPSSAVKQQKPPKSSNGNLAARVSSKLEEGDVRGAIRIAASEDTIVSFNDVTAAALRAKHPARVRSDTPPPSPSFDSGEPCLIQSEADILAAVKTFVPGSAAGPDGLRPQHLKDLTSASAGDAGRRLLASLTNFTNMCLRGRVPVVIQPVFCGASLCALNKKGGGLRPIAVGNTLRRLVSKTACRAVTAKMAMHFLPVQLGFGVPRATEAAAHAARQFISDIQPGYGLLKLDFINAFNNVRRDTMLESVREELSELYPFVYMCYSNASLLNFDKHMIVSDEGAQQGDPLGPLLFCLSSLKLARSMVSEFNCWYLDDGSLGGKVEDLLQDLDTVRRVGPALGLHLNEDKTEIVTNDASVAKSIRSVTPNVRQVMCGDAMLLGAPIGDDSTVDNALNQKLREFQCLSSRLTSLSAHDALFLLKNCFSLPKLLYTLRCAPCYRSTILLEYDVTIKKTLQTILNINLIDMVWSQATLPVSNGGLGIRLATDLALPAFLSSLAGCVDLSLQLLPSRLHSVGGTQDTFYISAGIEWQSRCGMAVPDAASIGAQKAWDSPQVLKKFDEVFAAAQTQSGRARIIAAAAPHSGDFLNVLPCSAVGTRLDDTSLRIAVALRLGAVICAPHTCVCGEQVDSSGIHGLACRKSAGRHMRHNAVNDLIKRALASAEIPSLLEPSSLSRDDGKRPDGLTVMPWTNGRCLIWDFTCPDTLAASHINRAVTGPGVVADDAEQRKTLKYRSLSPHYHFTPIAVETLGAIGQEALTFFLDLGRRIATITAEPRSLQFLLQRLSVAIQRGNAACVLGTVQSSNGWDELF
jgi:hypothetical protein